MDEATVVRFVIGPGIVLFQIFIIWFSLIYVSERPPSQDDHEI